MARILLIESDRLLASSAKRILRRAGHTVDVQVDLQAAINSADQRHPDVIILELLLAGRSGVEFLYEFRSYADWVNLPIIIYSSLPSEEFNEAGISLEHLNISAYLHKPAVGLGQLVQSINRVLQPAGA